MWDPEIWQSAREGKKWRPVYYYTPPLAPRRFLQGGPRARAQISQSARAAPKVARIRDQIDEQIGEQNPPKVDQKGDPAGLSARHR